MRDLDFDELDKAVNSLIASTPSGSGGSPQDISTVVSKPTGGSLPTIPIAPQKSVVSRPNTGKVMDISRSQDRGSLKMPERALAPVVQGTVGLPKTNTPSPVPMSVFAQPKSILQTTIQSPVVSSNNDIKWPDPINMGNSSVVNNTIQNKDEDDDIDRISNDITNTLNGVSQQQNSVPETPFIADAKVEKRPLGAFSEVKPSTPPNTYQSSQSMPSQQVPSQMQTATIKAAPVNSNDAGPSNANAPTPMPAELQKDLLSIESDTTVGQSSGMNGSTSNNVMSTGAVSIAQQYSSQPANNQTSGAIYDTKDYHKSIKKVAGKKSNKGLIIILILVILLAIAAAYFYILPQFGIAL